MKIGKLSESVLKRSVLRQLKTKNDCVVCGAGVGNDCARFAFSDAADLVSCMQEGVVFVPEKSSEGCAHPAAAFPEDIASESCTMTKLIQKCVNNLAAGCADPVAVMISLILPESIEEPQIKSLMAETEKVCGSYGMEIAGGQTRVSLAVNAPVAVVTGYGKKAAVGKSAADYGKAAKAKPGQDIVLSKWIALEGTAMLARSHRQQLLERYPEYLVEEATGFDRYLSILPEAATAVKSNVCAMHDASEGGIFAALWELAESAGVGLTIDLKKIPLRQETVEVCELCNVNPYELKSGGCLVMTTEDGLGLQAALEAVGIPAAVIGKITDSKDRLIINEEEVRYMDRPRTDAIY